ncbi:MAG: transporter substrate-binding domain-containing protein [Proteobacteria bacterium]|nr:transporter substrate-binding domain-containing protein [Pseudomonadota bacterium]MBU1737969.1 transporter substrate-binding domain-containing protein [Pseudomonadota bacterium]
MNKPLLNFVSAFLATAFFLAPNAAMASVGDTVYKVAVDRNYAPYEFVDVDGEIKGFTPDLLQAIGKSTGVTFRLVPMDWPEAVASLADGRIDLINMIRTPKRQEQYEFSEPHSYIKQGIFRNISYHDITDLSSLAGHRVALQKDDISLEMLAGRIDFKRTIVHNKTEGFLLLNAGKVDAFLAAEQAGLRLIREYDLANVEPAAVDLFPRDYCFAARMGNKHLIDLLNGGLKHLKTSGSYNEIIETWFTLKPPDHSWLVHHWHKVAGFIGVISALLICFIVWSVMLRKAVDQRTHAVRKSRDTLNEAQRIARLGSWEWDIESDTLHWSDEAFRIFGIDPEKFTADFKAFIEAVHPDDRLRVRNDVEKAIRDGIAEWTIDYRILLPGNELHYLHEEARSVFSPDGRVVKRVGTVQDVTEQRELEDSLRRINRKLTAISNCNQILMKAEEEQTLLDEVCRIICEEAGYRLAWVGFAEHDAEKSIKPVAWDGFDSDYVAEAKLSWSPETEKGQGPAGMVIRSGTTIQVQDFKTDPRLKPWRESALSHGYRSGMALPLKDERGVTFGALLIYSAEPYTATPEEITLMQELAGDLAFGITVQRNRAKQREAERALRENQKLLLEAQHMAHIGNWWHDLVTGEIFWSEEFFRILGIKPQKPTPALAAELFHPDDRPILDKAMQESATGKMKHEQDFRIIRPDGEVRWIHNHWIRVNDENGMEIKRVGTHQDITERKLAEEEIRQHLDRQKTLLDLYRTMTEAPVREILSFVVDRCVNLTGSTIGFIGLISDDDSYMEAQIWSETAMVNCPLDTPARFPLEDAGLWAEPVRKRGTIIVNDYSEPHPAKKGCPDGHLELVRFMGVPLVDKDRVVAVAAVANRQEAYVETDLDQMSLFLEGMWVLIKRKRAEEDLRTLNDQLDARVKERTAELSTMNAELERMNKLFVGREQKMMELKNKIKELEEEKA